MDLKGSGHVSRGRLSKRKLKRKAKRRRRRLKSKVDARRQSRVDCHHFFYQRKDYKTSTLKELREHSYCKVYITKDTTHKTIHALLKAVPVPKEANAKAAIRQLNHLFEFGAVGLNDAPEKRLAILAALFDCVEQPTANALRVQAAIIHKFTKKTPD